MLAKRREDYQPAGFSIPLVHLDFNLNSEATIVTNTMLVLREDHSKQHLRLDGQDLSLLECLVNGEVFSDYELTNDYLQLTLPDNEHEFTIVVKTLCNPKANTSLEGLYFASNTFCTQCEAEGFRRITYFLDRPDILSSYSVSITADKDAYPYLLSNGNLTSQETLADGKHKVSWQDPHKKPAYLFALVAGDFDLLEGHYVTSSGREVALQIFVEQGRQAQAEHALVSLQKSMRWDEETYGLEYDLDIYMVVAVDFFNMGAMENKGLNIFNSKFVLAQPQSATDEDYFNIESIIAHEYFHNWTGNRVTCRDWFQLSLKEGLTVFRDQQFSADMTSELSNRIKQINVMRSQQFAEDASAMAHPIRPDEVIEMNNFYTLTVYDKGAEVIRMLHTLLGKDGFRKGMDLYFARHDGQAVTCDDFIAAMQDANAYDLSYFAHWYSQSGTPQVTVQQLYDAAQKTLTVVVKQETKPTFDQKNKRPLLLPIKYECIAANGAAQFCVEDAREGLVIMTDTTQTMTFKEVPNGTYINLFTDFSAPVRINQYNDLDAWFHILRYAKQPLTIWEASQNIYSSIILDAYHALSTQQSVDFASVMNWQTFNTWLEAQAGQPELLAEVLSLPTIEQLLQDLTHVDILLLHAAKAQFEKALATFSYNTLQALFTNLDAVQSTYAYRTEDVHRRKLKNVILQYISIQEPNACFEQFVHSNNMTDLQGALKIAININHPRVDWLLNEFKTRWSHDLVVMDKWFAMQASQECSDILAKLTLLQEHPAFSINNPNKVRALIGSFAMFNTVGFHAEDGSGYRYVADFIMELDRVNAQVAARLVTPLTQWQKYNTVRQRSMCAQLERILVTPDLSKDVYEKVSKSLAQS